MSTKNVSNVKNMSDMFYFAVNFNQPLENRNVANVTDMYGSTFFTALTAVIDICFERYFTAVK